MINPELEPNATVCFDCIVTLEGFFQFKEQCQTNDEFLKTLPPEDSYEGSVASDEEEEEKGDEEDEATMEYDYLQENDDDDDTRDSEEQGLVEDVEEYEPPRKTTKNMVKNPKKTAKTKESEPVEKATGKKTADDPLTTRQSKRLKKNKSALRTSLKPKKINSVPNKLINGIAIPEFPGPEPTDDDLPKLQESYPDFFHFERNSRSLYFTLVYYGERFNSAVYGPGFTYWQCAHRYKFKCPAWIHVSNDYTEFERRYEHTHGEQKVKGKPELLTPLQALPAVFRIWWHRSKEINPEVESDAVLCFDCIVTLEGFLQFKMQCHMNDEYLKTLPAKSSTEVSDASDDDEGNSEYVQDDEEEVSVPSRDVYESEEEGLIEDVDLNEPTVASAQPDPEVDNRKSTLVHKPTAKVVAISHQKPQKVATPTKTDSKPARKRQKVDPSKIREPMANELPKLRDSYPDYFHFERGPRTVHYNLIYYGERYNSAVFSSRNTYWQCAYRRKFRCPAMLYASNDYVNFERRNEHTHGDMEEMGEHDLFTPKQALPELFRICWRKMMERKVKRQEMLKLKKDKTSIGEAAEEESATDGEAEFLDCDAVDDDDDDEK